MVKIAVARVTSRRVRPLLLVLLWIWAACVFLVLDLFLNVEALDDVRPRSTLYRGMRKVAHEAVGEPYAPTAQKTQEPQRRIVTAAPPCIAMRRGVATPRGRASTLADEATATIARSHIEPPAWKANLDAERERAVGLIEALSGNTWPYGRSVDDTLPPVRDLVVRRWADYRSGALTGRHLTFKEGGLLLVAGSIEESATVFFKEPAGLTVSGNVEGRVVFRGNATVYVRGDLRGTLCVDGRSSVLVDGDVLGRLEIDGDAVVYLGGRVAGTIVVGQSARAHFYLSAPFGKLEGFAGDLGAATLHLPPEARVGVGAATRWKAVHIGGEEWTSIR